jgi:uncharacterized oligopeptide transporter (OPT) family protein
MTAVGLSIVASICHIGRFYLPPKYAIWIPNWNAVGLAFVVPQVYYGIAMAVGSIFAMVWVRIFLFSTLFLFPFTVRIADPLSSFLFAFAFSQERRRPQSWEVWGFALAAGMIAGEGIGGVLTALFVILKIDGSVYGVATGCALNEYCG